MTQARRRVHLAVDARMVGDGGIGTYLSQLLPHVARDRPDWQVTLLGDPAALRGVAAAAGAGIRRCDAPIYSVAEQLRVPAAVPADATIVWAPHYNIPVLVRGPRLVVTLHDVSHLALPEMTGGVLRRGYARAMHQLVRRRAAGVLFDSVFSRDEMTRFAGPPRGISAVAYLGVDAGWGSARREYPESPLEKPYLLYVGNFKERKNVPRLVRAFARLRDRVPHQLVLVGRREGLRADPAIPAAIAVAGDRVVTTGEVAPAVLRRFVAHADALVTASLHEGFGLPPLEAMAAGVPTLVSTAGSLPEICGDASLYCDPLDEDDIAARMLEIATRPDLRRILVGKGLARAASFTWQRCAHITAALLEDVALSRTSTAP